MKQNIFNTRDQINQNRCTRNVIRINNKFIHKNEIVTAICLKIPLNNKKINMENIMTCFHILLFLTFHNRNKVFHYFYD